MQPDLLKRGLKWNATSARGFMLLPHCKSTWNLILKQDKPHSVQSLKNSPKSSVYFCFTVKPQKRQTQWMSLDKKKIPKQTFVLLSSYILVKDSPMIYCSEYKWLSINGHHPYHVNSSLTVFTTFPPITFSRTYQMNPVQGQRTEPPYWAQTLAHISLSQFKLILTHYTFNYQFC